VDDGVGDRGLGLDLDPLELGVGDELGERLALSGPQEELAPVVQ
jgi:hypothetical protein